MSIDYKSIAVQLAGTVDLIMSQLANQPDVTSEQQGIVVSHGVNSYTFKTDQKPNQVFLSIASNDAQVCGGDVDTAGVTLADDGFTIYANIASNSATITWIMMV